MTSLSARALGGLAGAAVAKAGFGALDLAFFGKTALFIILSPLIGAVLGFVLMRLTMLIFGRRSPPIVAAQMFRKSAAPSTSDKVSFRCQA